LADNSTASARLQWRKGIAMNNDTVRTAALRLSICTGLVAICTGCATHAPSAGKPAPLAAAKPAPAPAATARESAAPPRFTTAERLFASAAAANSLYEVEASRLALARAANPQVKAYAQMMVEQLSQANHELAALMRAKGMTPPHGLAADKLTKLHRLTEMNEANFDKAYVRSVGIDDHQADVARFERAAHEANDRDLKAWIGKVLPTLRGHLEAAQKTAAALG
jgi:putative membrane protein